MYLSLCVDYNHLKLYLDLMWLFKLFGGKKKSFTDFPLLKFYVMAILSRRYRLFHTALPSHIPTPPVYYQRLPELDLFFLNKPVLTHRHPQPTVYLGSKS